MGRSNPPGFLAHFHPVGDYAAIADGAGDLPVAVLGLHDDFPVTRPQCAGLLDSGIVSYLVQAGALGDFGRSAGRRLSLIHIY